MSICIACGEKPAQTLDVCQQCAVRESAQMLSPIRSDLNQLEAERDRYRKALEEIASVEEEMHWDEEGLIMRCVRRANEALGTICKSTVTWKIKEALKDE